jgi:hypothetical protein
MAKIRCVKCRQFKTRRKERQPKNPTAFVCLGCRRYKRMAEHHLDKIIPYLKPFKEIRTEALAAVETFEKTVEVLTPQVRQQSFLTDIKNIMTKNNIRDYRFEVEDNKLIAIILEGLPLLGDVRIQILTK